MTGGHYLSYCTATFLNHSCYYVLEIQEKWIGSTEQSKRRPRRTRARVGRWSRPRPSTSTGLPSPSPSNRHLQRPLRRVRVVSNYYSDRSPSYSPLYERTSPQRSGIMSSGRNSSGGDGVASSSRPTTAQNNLGESTSGILELYPEGWRPAVGHGTEARRPRRRRKLASWSASSPSVTPGRHRAARTQHVPAQSRRLPAD